MSDYGFATYDGSPHNRRQGIINSKWPIFGPKYKDIKHSYKTWHISDTTQSDPSQVDLNVPQPAQSYSTNSAHRYFKIEMFRAKHGYKKRPLGYAMFTGTVVKNVRGYINQYYEGGPSAYGGQFTLYGTNTATIPVVSSIDGQMQTAYTSSGYDPYALTLENSFFTIYDGSVYFPQGDILVSQDVVSSVKKTYAMYDGNDPEYVPIPGSGFCLPPYSVEITDEYIIVYKNVYKLEEWARFDSGSTRVYDRIKGVTDFAGTEVDMTVILCPYSMEDLL